MKPLYLLDYRGAVQPGRATLEQIADVLEGRETDRLATVRIDDDGAIAITPLDASSLAELRLELASRYRVALEYTLDAALALIRREPVPGVVVASYYTGSVSVDLAASPWAEAVVFEWAERNSLHVEGESPPAKGGSWARTAHVRLDDKSYSMTVATLRWAPVTLSAESIVAADADAEGRLSEAAEIRSSIEVPF